jgi:hypothetical protein
VNPPPRRIFISYSHMDERLKERLVRHLRVVRRSIQLEVWEDRQIQPGTVFPEEIRAAIERADAALLLISADFLTSAYVQDVEVPLMRERQQAGQLRIVPVLAQPCAWQDVDWLATLQVHPTDLRPLSEKEPAQVESDLTNLARLLLAPPRDWWKDPEHVGEALRYRLRGAGVALVATLPALMTACAIAWASATKGATPIQLDLVARAVSFTIASDAPVQLLNNLTPFSRLTVDGCDAVALPPLAIGIGDVTPVASPKAVSFRCHQRIIGSKIAFRPLDRTFTGELGSLGAIAADNGDRVVLELMGNAPPQLRLQVSRPASVDFELERDVPFEILSEYTEAEGIEAPIGPEDVGSYHAYLPGTSRLRLGRVDTSHGLNILMQLTGGADLSSVFKGNPDTRVESLSLFQRDETSDGFVATTIEGGLSYPERPDIAAVRIDSGDAVRLAGVTAFELKRLTISEGSAGFSLRVHGNFAEATIAGEDRRLTRLQRAWGNKALVAFVLMAAAALQWAWLRRFVQGW